MMKARIKHNGKLLEGVLNQDNQWFEVFGVDVDLEDIGCYELYAIDPIQDGFTFTHFYEVKDMVRNERTFIELEQWKHGGVYKFHYHGFRVLVDGNWVGDACTKLTLATLKWLVEDTEKEYPNSNIEIYLEGHYDFWDSYTDLFNGEEYQPSDDYIDILLYSKTIK